MKPLAGCQGFKCKSTLILHGALVVPPPPALLSLTPGSSEGSRVHPPGMMVFLLTMVWVVQLSCDRSLWPTIHYTWNRCCSCDWQWNQRSSFSKLGRLEGEEHSQGLVQPPDPTWGVKFGPKACCCWHDALGLTMLGQETRFNSMVASLQLPRSSAPGMVRAICCAI